MARDLGDFIEKKTWELQQMQEKLSELKDHKRVNHFNFQNVEGSLEDNGTTRGNIENEKGDVTIEITTHSREDGTKRQFRYTLPPQMRKNMLEYLHKNRRFLEEAFDKDIEAQEIAIADMFKR